MQSRHRDVTGCRSSQEQEDDKDDDVIDSRVDDVIGGKGESSQEIFEETGLFDPTIELQDPELEDIGRKIRDNLKKVATLAKRVRSTLSLIPIRIAIQRPSILLSDLLIMPAVVP